MVNNKKGKEHNRYIHGMFGTRPYRIWTGMLTRCSNKNDPTYILYGDKGVTVCKRWRSFVFFWEDMKEGYADDLQIDRMNNSKGYCKSNCRWATKYEQARNKSNVKLYKYGGEMLPISVIAKRVGINRVTLMQRLEKGLEFNVAISLPLQSGKKLICTKK